MDRQKPKQPGVHDSFFYPEYSVRVLSLYSVHSTKYCTEYKGQTEYSYSVSVKLKYIHALRTPYRVQSTCPGNG